MTSAAVIRPIQTEDDAAVARIIRTVMPEFGADGPGFAIHDAEVDHMTAAYGAPRCAYFVVDDGGRVTGGGGVGPLAGSDDSICELRKMYFLEEARHRGLGKRVLLQCIEAARQIGYATIYLETLTGMDAAQRLYEHIGFARIPAQLGATGHFACDKYYTLALR